MGLRIVYDPRKAESNAAKHGVTFYEGASAFGDPLSVTTSDPRPYSEERLVLLGRSDLGRLIVVVHTCRKGWIRLISARKATRRERREYEEGRA